jgi:hypothetical protein
MDRNPASAVTAQQMTLSHAKAIDTKMNVKNILKIGSHRAVNTHHLSYKHQSVSAV